MKNAIKPLLFILFLTILSCGEKDSDIYGDTGDTGNTGNTGNTGDTGDENGCGPIEQPDDSDITDHDSPLTDNDYTDNDSPLTDNDSPLTDNDSPLTDNDSPLTDNDSPLTDNDSPLTDNDYTDNDSPLTDNDSPLTDCPDDMVEIGSICIDKYDVSRKDATETDQGSETEIAYSKKGVMPWMVNPMTNNDYEEFKAACEEAGKRLCKDEEWMFACEGPENLKYSWGNEWERTTCNNVDTFCDDYCEDNEIPVENCDLSENCGYNYYCFNPVPTGTFENCTNFAGAFDINGNVWNVTDTGSGYKVRGGAYNCGSPSKRLECTFSATWPELFAGFRCCKDR